MDFYQIQTSTLRIKPKMHLERWLPHATLYTLPTWHVTTTALTTNLQKEHYLSLAMVSIFVYRMHGQPTTLLTQCANLRKFFLYFFKHHDGYNEKGGNGFIPGLYIKSDLEPPVASPDVKLALTNFGQDLL